MITSAQKSFECNLSLADEIGKAVQALPLILDHYLPQDMYMRRNQIVDSKHALPNIDEAHSRSLAVYFGNCNYD